MAKIAKNYPVIPRTKRLKDVLYGGKKSAKSTTNRGNYFYTYKTYSNGILIENVSDSGSQVVGTDDASYTNNPGWRVAVAKGSDATSPYSRAMYLNKPYHYSVSSASRVGNTYSSSGYGTFFGRVSTALAPAAIQTRVSDLATARLKNRLNGYIGNAQLAAPLAESREIHRLVRQINDLGFQALHAVIAAKKTKGRSISKLFGDIWLGFGFGINPMLKDIQSAADSILKYTTRQDMHVRVQGAASEDWTDGITTLVGSPVCYGTDLWTTRSSRYIFSVRIVAGIDLQTRTAASYSVADHLGLKIEQVPSVLWELTPFSWAVDYFATVGPWLEDMFYTLPGTCKYVSKAVKYQVETLDVPYFKTIPAFGVTCQGSGSTAVCRSVDFNRIKLSTLPTRALRIKSADEIASHGLTKLLNLASVIAGKHGS